MSIALAFRPDSYSDFDDPVALALNGINGQMRRVMVRDMMTAEGETRDHYDDTLGPIDPALLDEQSDEDRVRFRNSTLGPSWLGGEYLPRRKSQEVEIARVVLNSVLMDVFSLRARWSGGRYHYRLVDEYDSNITICRKTSRRTLTLRQVIEVLDSAAGDLSTEGAGIPEAFWDQQWEYGDRPEACTAFAWVESEVYPELPDWYDQRAEAWRAEREAETADGVEDVDVEEDESRFDADAPVGVVTLPEPWGSTFQVSLTRPDGWRWVNGSEWRRDEEDLDPDLLALVRPSGADLDHPSLLLSKSPPGFEGEAPEIQVRVYPPDPDREAYDAEAITRGGLESFEGAYDDFVLVRAPEPFLFHGFPGWRAACQVTQPRRDEAPFHWDLWLMNIEVADALLSIALAAPHLDAPEGTWEELFRHFDSVQIHTGPSSASEAA